MNFRITVEDPLEHACQALIIGCFEDEVGDSLFTKIDRAMGGYLGDLYRQHEFSGKANKTRLIHTLGRISAERLILVGLGKKKDLTGERIRQGAGAAMQAMRGTRLQGCTTLLHLAGRGGDEFLQAAVEGAALGGYSFSHYKTRNDENGGIEEVQVLFPPGGMAKTADKVLAEAQKVCEAVLFARDLVAQPGNVATPSYLAEKGVEMSAKYGIACRVMEGDEMEQNGMEALLAVAKGSRQPPRFIILS